MRPTIGYRLKLVAVVVLAAAGLICAVSVSVAATYPHLNIPFASSVGLVTEVRASEASMNPIKIGRAAMLNRAVIAATPMSANAWSRAAYLQAIADNGFDDSAFEALERSYTVAPFGPEISLWRLTFLYENWGEITPSLRAQAAAELDALTYKRGGAFRSGAIQNPAGRLSASLTLRAALNRRATDVAAERVTR